MKQIHPNPTIPNQHEKFNHKFKLALLQMLVEGGNKAKNLSHAEELIVEAASNGADIVLLPEAMDLGWTHPSAQSEADSILDGKTCLFLRKIAQTNSIYVCSGLIEKDRDNVFNSAVIIDRNGNVILRHRKLNELDIGHEYYDQGDRLNVCHTELGTLGLMICADGFARNEILSRSLGYMGADIILSPGAWALPADHKPDRNRSKEPGVDCWRKVYMPVAKDFLIYIVGVSNVGWITAGPWKGMKCIGCSLVIGPDGNEILQGPYGVDAEKILYVDINLTKRPARGCDWEKYWKNKKI